MGEAISLNTIEALFSDKEKRASLGI